MADENLHYDIVRGILRRAPDFDIVRAQDLPEVSGQCDLALLSWAAQDDRIVLTHDVSTMVPAMQEQRRQGLRCAAIVLVPDSLPIGAAIEDILLLEDCAVEADVAKVDGAYRIGGTRVSLDSLVYLYREGVSVESMVDSYPVLTHEQVHGTLAFYLASGRSTLTCYQGTEPRSPSTRSRDGRIRS